MTPSSSPQPSKHEPLPPREIPVAMPWKDEIFGQPVAPSPPAARPDLLELVERAWGIIASTSDGDWSQQSSLWREAATEVRGRFYAALNAYASASSEGPSAAPGPVQEVNDALYSALDQLVRDWESVPEDAQVPDEINTDEHWDSARAALRDALPNIFDERPAPVPSRATAEAVKLVEELSRSRVASPSHDMRVFEYFRDRAKRIHAELIAEEGRGSEFRSEEGKVNG